MKKVKKINENDKKIIKKSKGSKFSKENAIKFLNRRKLKKVKEELDIASFFEDFIEKDEK